LGSRRLHFQQRLEYAGCKAQFFEVAHYFLRYLVSGLALGLPSALYTTVIARRGA
jgi:hypothetical protein